MPQVPRATDGDTRAFCDLCQWVDECWTMHSNLFERLPEHLQDERNVPLDHFLETPYGRCLSRLNEISQQYVILQIAKLHDPARQGRNENLSIDFFVKQEFWSDEELPTIEGIGATLGGLYRQIEDLRNKILAHNDRSVFAKGSPLGSFSEGEDEHYFRALGQLCSMIWNKFPDSGWTFGARIFDFTKAGICGDSLCLSNDARELGRLIVEAFPTALDDIDRL